MQKFLSAHDRALLVKAVAKLREAAEAIGAAHEIADEMVGHALYLQHKATNHGEQYDAAIAEWSAAYDELRSGYSRMMECIRPHLT